MKNKEMKNIHDFSEMLIPFWIDGPKTTNALKPGIFFLFAGGAYFNDAPFELIFLFSRTEKETKLYYGVTITWDSRIII